MTHATTRPISHHAPDRHRLAEIGARVGFAGHGLAYGLIAIFALDAAISSGGESAKSSRQALTSIGGGVWGQALLTVLAIGLVCYAVLRLWQGLANPEGHDHDAKGFAKRAGRCASGGAQLLLGIYAADLAWGWFSGVPGSAGGGGGAGGSGSSGTQDITARVMAWEGGRWIIAFVGLCIVGAGLAQLKHAIKADFMEKFSSKARRQDWIEPLGRVGFSARFVVFCIVGGLIITAAVKADPSEAEGLGGALRTLQQQAYGPWLLGAVALGLLAFAVLRGVFARYWVYPRNA